VAANLRQCRHFAECEGLTGERPLWLAEDTVRIERVSGHQFPVNREFSRENSQIPGHPADLRSPFHNKFNEVHFKFPIQCNRDFFWG
jgi:hypothetical protein